MSVAELIDAIRANTYNRNRPPTWMLKNRDYFRLVQRLLQRLTERNR